MGTRSTIAIAREDGTVAKVYCHWDGYLTYNGYYLEQYYNTPEKIEELLGYGDISSLGETIGVKHPFSAIDANLGHEDYEQQFGSMTKFYGRDRGESDTDARVYASVEEYESSQFEEFNYLFISGEWYYKSYDEKVRDVKTQLTLELLKEAA